MATLTQPDDTGTLDRAAVQETAGRTGKRRVSAEDLDRHAAELRAWLDTHGTIDEAELARQRVASRSLVDPREFAAGRPGLLVHQPVWLPVPGAYEPPAHAELEVLVDGALATLDDAQRASFPDSFSALPPRTQDERRVRRNRSLGWGAVVAMWALSAALLIPLALWGLVGSFDMTIDLEDTGTPVAEQGSELPADAVEPPLADG